MKLGYSPLVIRAQEEIRFSIWGSRSGRTENGWSVWLVKVRTFLFICCSPPDTSQLPPLLQSECDDNNEPRPCWTSPANHFLFTFPNPPTVSEVLRAKEMPHPRSQGGLSRGGTVSCLYSSFQTWTLFFCSIAYSIVHYAETFPKTSLSVPHRKWMET